MKRIIIILGILMLSLTVFSQKVDKYVTHNGDTLSIGDTLVIGKPLAGAEYSYIYRIYMGSWQLNIRHKEKDVIITKLKKERGKMVVYTTIPIDCTLTKKLYILLIDDAIKDNEIIIKK